MMYTRTKLVFVFLLCSLASTWANAHVGVEPQAHFSFVSGFLHPLGGLDHLTTMLALGIWSALMVRRAGLAMLWGPACFVSMLLLGAVLGLHGLEVAGVEPMISTSVVVAGLLVAGRWQMPAFAVALLVGSFAIFHGLAHGYELSSSPQAWQALAGLTLASMLLCATGLAIGWSLRGLSYRMTRYLGLAIALFGGVLWFQLA